MSDYKYKQTEDSVNKFEFEVEVQISRFNETMEEAYKKLAKEVKIPGFRPGKGPKEVIKKKLGAKLYDETLKRVLPEITYEIIEKEELNPITYPEYNLDKFLPEEGVTYKFSFTNYPEIKLGDFKKIKMKKEEVEVEDEATEKIIRNMIKNSLPKDKLEEFGVIKKTGKGKKGDQKEEAEEKGKKKKKKKEDSKSKKQDSKKAEEKKDDEQVKQEDGKIEFIEDFEITDEMIKELKYEDVKTVDEMEDLVEDRLEEMQEREVEQKFREEVINKAIELSKFEVPDVFIDQEVHRMQHDFEDQLKSLGLEMDAYLKAQEKKLEDLQKDWRESAERKVRADLIFLTLAVEEKVVPTDEDIDAEIEKIEDENVRKQYEEDSRAKDYIKTVLTRQAGLEKLMEMVED